MQHPPASAGVRGRAQATIAAVELFLLPVSEPLVDNRSICGQRNAVQINDIGINNQLDVDRDSRSRRITYLTGGRTVDDNPRFAVRAKKKVRTTHQADGSPFAF